MKPLELSQFIRSMPEHDIFPQFVFLDEFVKSLFGRHPGERRGPEPHELTGFRLSPE
jgi:hypothetical protein